jgi:hypothetical protein
MPRSEMQHPQAIGGGEALIAMTATVVESLISTCIASAYFKIAEALCFTNRLSCNTTLMSLVICTDTISCVRVFIDHDHTRRANALLQMPRATDSRK